MFDPGFGFLKIRTTDIDDVAVERIAQEFGAGERTDEGDLGCRCDRLAGFRRRRSDGADKSKNLFFGDCSLGGLDGFFRLVTIVDRLKLKLASVDPAVAVGLFESRKDTLAHALAECLCRPIQRSDLTEQDLVFGYAVLRAKRSDRKA